MAALARYGPLNDALPNDCKGRAAVCVSRNLSVHCQFESSTSTLNGFQPAQLFQTGSAKLKEGLSVPSGSRAQAPPSHGHQVGYIWLIIVRSVGDSWEFSLVGPPPSEKSSASNEYSMIDSGSNLVALIPSGEYLLRTF